MLQANPEDQWDTVDGDPFHLTEQPDGRLVGRGSTDDKGPIVGWLNVLKYHHDNQKQLPVNLRYCFEGMEENGSQGLDDKVKKEAEDGGWFHGVDAVCIVSRPFVLFIPSRSVNPFSRTCSAITIGWAQRFPR